MQATSTIRRCTMRSGQRQIRRSTGSENENAVLLPK
jgi:hypothetical protein